MNKTTLLVAIATFAAGTAIGWIAGTSSDGAKTAVTGESKPKGKRKIADSGRTVRTVTTTVTNILRGTESGSAETEKRQSQNPGDFIADIERMKTEDPGRYAAMTNRMEEFRKRMMRRTESKLETLAAIDTSGWSKSHIETHEKYQNLIARREELMDILRHDSGVSQQERSDAFSELRNLGREIRQTGARERNILLDKTFRELGYNGSDAAEIRETVKTIFSTTEEWGGHGRHGGGRPGHRR